MDNEAQENEQNITFFLIQTAWMGQSLPLFKSDPLTGALAWNADCLDGWPINFRESGEGPLWLLPVSPRLR
uniref:Myb transcription factor n=1 Tax=Rhizophora mucronata TaxID=61149 RepID=A0A2P2PX91_RHIMU